MTTVFWFLLTFLASPFLLLATHLRRREKPRRFLIITVGKLGDTICTTPVYRAIKEHEPDAQVHVLCLTSTAKILANNPFIAQIHTIDESTNRWELIKKIRSLQIDVTINTMPTSFGSMLGVWILSKVRINAVSDIHGILIKLLGLLQTANIHYGLGLSTFKHYMMQLEKAGIPTIPYKLDFFPSEDAKKQVETWMKERELTPHSFVVLNVTAGNKVKEWPAEKFAALAQHIIDDRKLKVVISTADHEAAKHVLTLIGRTDVIDASTLTLEQSAALYAHSVAFVAVDTGPMYLANAMGCSVVVMLGPVDPNEQVPPEGPHVAHVPPPAGTKPWMFVARSPRTASPEQLRAAQDTSVEAVIHGLKKVLP